jgi:hypothetical protein
VDDDYTRLLGRQPQAAELGGWLQMLQSGLTGDALTAKVAASGEYYSRQGGSPATWIDALYSDVLGRAADAAGEHYWMDQLQSGLPRAKIAARFLDSPEGACADGGSRLPPAL